MNSMHRRIALVSALVAIALLVGGAPAAAGERAYDGAVSKMIDAANSGLGKFTREMSGKAKGAKITRGETEVDISDFLEDFKTEGRRMNERFSQGDTGDQNVQEFLRKAKNADNFFARHPGFTGAETEWAALKPTIMGLASAYGIDWEGDPAAWRAGRMRDSEIDSMIKGLDTQVKGVGKSLGAAGKAAKVDKAALKSLTAQSKSLAGASSALKKAFSKKQPFSAAAGSYLAALGKVQDAASSLGIADSVPAMKSIADATGKISQALRL